MNLTKCLSVQVKPLVTPSLYATAQMGVFNDSTSYTWFDRFGVQHAVHYGRSERDFRGRRSCGGR